MLHLHKQHLINQMIVVTRCHNVLSADSLSLTPPGGGAGDSGEQAERDQDGQPLVQELWFIAVMAGIALLLLAVVLGFMLHKVRGIT